MARRVVLAGYLLWMTVAVALYFFVPSLEVPAWTAAGVGSTLAILVGVRLNRPEPPGPWLLLAGAVFTYAVADFVYYFALGHPDAGLNPRTDDVLYVIMFVLLTARPPAPHAHRRGRARPRGADRRAHLHVRDRPAVLDLHRRAPGRGAGARPDREDHRGRLSPGRRGDPRHGGAARGRRPVDAHRPAPRLRRRRHAGLRRHLPPDPDRGHVGQRRAGRRRLAGVLRLLGGGRPPPVDARADRAARHRTAPRPPPFGSACSRSRR